MTPTTDAALARLSLAAYSDTPAALPAGFTALDLTNFHLPLRPEESFSGGVFRSGNGAALVTVGEGEGLPSIVVAFRGSDDAVDSQQNLNGINQAYASFGTLVATLDQASQNWGMPVIVTGHSLGGAMAQLYMADHPNRPGEPGRTAITFGSPGAILPPGEDERIANYVIADDAAVVLGAQRAWVGELLRGNPALADLAAERIAAELPGLTREQALASLPNLTVNYDNRGAIVLLPTREGRLDRDGVVAGLAQGDPERHAPELYVAEVADAWTAPGQSRVVPAAPTPDQELAFLRALYDRDGRDSSMTGAVVRDLVGAWADNLGSGFRTGLGDLAGAAGRGLDPL